MDKATYSETCLWELVDAAVREGRDYWLAPKEELDAEACIALGLRTINNGLALLTDKGRRFIINLNT